MTISEELQKNAKYLNPFVFADLIGYPLHIVNHDGIVIYVNKMWVQTYKVEPHAIIGKHINELSKLVMAEASFSYEVTSNGNNVLSDSRPHITNYHQMVTESPALVALHEHRQVTLVCREKSGHLTVCQSSPIYDGQGTILYVLTSVQNISVYSNWQVQLDIMSPENIATLSEKEVSSCPSIIGDSRQMLLVKHLIFLVAKTDATVLISGESGSGKELVATEIYRHSTRRNKPFLTVNCAAIPKDLIESELFGFEKGAFTGALQRRIGLFEQANGGTLLLDEIGEMPIQLQAKLLRVLQSRELMRIGGTETIPVDVRIIAATNKNLLDEIKLGTFRADLYYRLNVFPIELPPLRSRENDIPKLAEYFLQKFNGQYGLSKEFSPQAIRALSQYNWPGNARELENFVERLVIITPQDVIRSSLVLALMNERLSEAAVTGGAQEEDELSLKEAVDNCERELIYRVLQKYKSTYKAAKVLKTSQPTIVRKAKQLGISGWK